jgi:DNA invertase Pin-like site-specific DNA recombinase
MNIYPKDKNNANFNKQTHPNEIYITVMPQGKTNELKAFDIHEYSLETHKYIYEYNNSVSKLVSNKNPTGFIYARCSTTNDISIETQRQACFDYAKSKGIRLLSFGYQYDNNVSARNMNNLNFELGFWEKHIPDGSNMIIYSVDRLSRNLLKGIQFLESLSARGINIHFITNEIIYNKNVSAAAKSMIQQELQTAEKYSNMTSEKIKGTLKRLKEEGHIFGRAPYGYKHVKMDNIRKRVANNQERENIRKIKNRYNNYKTSFENFPENVGIKKSNIAIVRQLVRWCNRTGLKYRNDKNYTTQQIKYIVNLNFPTNNKVINDNNNNDNNNDNNNNNLYIDRDVDNQDNQDIDV